MVSVELARPPSEAGHIDDLRPDGPVSGPCERRPVPASTTPCLVVAAGILLVAAGLCPRERKSEFRRSIVLGRANIDLRFCCIFRVLKPSTSPSDREFLVILYAGAQSIIRWAYSPVMFQWFDELQHFRSLLNVLSTHHLFHTNFSLPISPRYPGLENLSAELAQVSSASAFMGGVGTASISHLMLPAAILLLFREVTQSSRVACIAVLLYMLSPQIHYFEASFVYENVAFPFLALAIMFSIRFATHQRQGYESFAGLLACVAIAVMTHHVTAIATVGLLACISFATSLFRDTRHLARPLAKCAASAALIVGCWISFVAPGTREYLGDVGPQILNGITQLGHAQGKARLPTSLAIPLIDRVCNPGGVALMLVLLVVSIRLARPLPPLQRLFVGLAPGLYAAMIFIRLFVGSASNGEHPDGAELAIRSLTYSSLFTALAVAVVLDRLVSTAAASLPWVGPHTERPRQCDNNRRRTPSALDHHRSAAVVATASRPVSGRQFRQWNRCRGHESSRMGGNKPSTRFPLLRRHDINGSFVGTVRSGPRQQPGIALRHLPPHSGGLCAYRRPVSHIPGRRHANDSGLSYYSILFQSRRHDG